jgi:hypothetical protein
VETALAQLGDSKVFDLVVNHLKTDSFQTEIQKLQITGGKAAAEALVKPSNYFDIPYGKPSMAALSRMVRNPPLPRTRAPRLGIFGNRRIGRRRTEMLPSSSKCLPTSESWTVY